MFIFRLLILKMYRSYHFIKKENLNFFILEIRQYLFRLSILNEYILVFYLRIKVLQNVIFKKRNLSSNVWVNCIDFVIFSGELILHPLIAVRLQNLVALALKINEIWELFTLNIKISNHVACFQKVRPILGCDIIKKSTFYKN